MGKVKGDNLEEKVEFFLLYAFFSSKFYIHRFFHLCLPLGAHISSFKLSMHIFGFKRSFQRLNYFKACISNLL